VISGFFGLLAEWAPVGANPPFPLENFPCKNAVVGECPGKQIDFGDGLRVPNRFPDERVFWSGGDLVQKSVADSSGVFFGIYPPASLILPLIFQWGFPL
jgi:hypothetical protein